MSSEPNPENQVNLATSEPSMPLFASIPTLISAYGFNPAFFAATSSLKKRTGRNTLLSGGFAIIIVFIVYSIVPLISFRLYGTGIAANLLLNIAAEDGLLPIILQVMFLVIAVMHIPMIFFFGKESVLIIFDEAIRHSYSRPESVKANAEVTAKVSPSSEDKSASENNDGGENSDIIKQQKIEDLEAAMNEVIDKPLEEPKSSIIDEEMED